MNKVTVYEDMWGQEALLTSEGKLCCLGFACAQLGVPLGDMVEQGMPHQVCANDLFVFADDYGDTEFAQMAADINDGLKEHGDLSYTARKQALTELFRDNGVTLVFEPKAPDDFRNDVAAAVEAYKERCDEG